jgi:hypothetical protein
VRRAGRIAAARLSAATLSLSRIEPGKRNSKREREREAAPDIKFLQGRQLLERRRQGRRALGADAITAAKERGRGGEGDKGTAQLSEPRCRRHRAERHEPHTLEGHTALQNRP